MDQNNLTSNDFQHIHDELMRHKEIIYELKEKCRKYEQELDESRSKYKFRGIPKFMQSASKEGDLLKENEILQHRITTLEREHEIKVDALKTELFNVRKLTLDTRHLDHRMSRPQAGDCRPISESTCDAACNTSDRLSQCSLGQQHSVKTLESFRDLVENTMTDINDNINILFSRLNKFTDSWTLLENALSCRYAMTDIISQTMRSQMDNQVILEMNPSSCLAAVSPDSHSDGVQQLAECRMHGDHPVDGHIHDLRTKIDTLKAELTAHRKRARAMIKDLQRELRVERSLRSPEDYHSTHGLTRGGGDVESVDSFVTDDTRSNISFATHSGGTHINENSIRLERHSGSFYRQNWPPPPANSSLTREQQEVLVAKVKHLEESNASMAQDLVDKANLIQQLAVGQASAGRNVSSLSSNPVGRSQSKRNVVYVDIERLQKALECTLKRNIEMEKILKEQNP